MKDDYNKFEEKSNNIVVVERDTNELTSEKFTGLTIGTRKKYAVGFPAITSSVVQMLKWMKPGDALKTMFKINQKGGFDCPGCAWPDPDDDRSKLGEYCENGIKAIAEEATKFHIGGDFFAKNSIVDLAQLSDYEIGKKGRISEPLILRGTHYEPISWEDAYKLIAINLNDLDSPDNAVFYTSGRASNEVAFIYQLFIREYGTNNMPDCSNMCHESSGKGLGATLGLGKGSVTLEDFYKTDLVIIIGQNPGTNHPRMLSALEKTKEHGGKIIAINPLPEPGLLHFVNPQNVGKMLTGGTPLADMFLQVKINADVALLKAIMVLMLQRERTEGSVFDWDFIKTKTEGVDELIADLEKQNFSELVSHTGISETQVREAADMIMAKKNIIICWAMGITQHKNAVGNIKEIVNLLLLKGSIGKPGAGTCPVRGHSNVQGDRTMGIFEAPSQAFLDKLGSAIGFTPPQNHGYDVVSAINAMHTGEAKVFFALGGNFLSATPDTEFTAQALRNCDLTVHVSTKLNRSHLVHGKTALILPCLGRTEIDHQASGEQFVTTENSMGVVQMSRGVLEPFSKNLKSETAIICELAHTTIANRSKIDYLSMRDDYDKIRDLIEKSIEGFDNFNRQVRQPAGFYLPNPPREQKFDTNNGKAKFTINTPARWDLKSGEYLMMTIRTHDQYNTTIYGLNDRYRGVYNERRVVLMNEKDMATAGYKSGTIVDLFSEYSGVKRTSHKYIVLPFDIPEECVATYFPEANVLIPIDSFADESRTPTSKSVVITMALHTSVMTN